jgi:hypothetical protein
VGWGAIVHHFVTSCCPANELVSVEFVSLESGVVCGGTRVPQGHEKFSPEKWGNFFGA